MLEVVDNYVLFGMNPKYFQEKEVKEAIKKASLYAKKYKVDVKLAVSPGSTEQEFNEFVEEFKAI